VLGLKAGLRRGQRAGAERASLSQSARLPDTVAAETSSASCRPYLIRQAAILNNKFAADFKQAGWRYKPLANIAIWIEVVTCVTPLINAFHCSAISQPTHGHPISLICINLRNDFKDIGRNQEATAVPASASRGNIQEKAANLYAEHTLRIWTHTR
jgi:hypothetical protein